MKFAATLGLAAAAVVGSPFGGGSARAKVTLEFDYTYDTNNFFTNANRRAVLEAAGQVYTDRFLDTLSAITPSGQNSWSPVFTHPGTGASQSVNNPSIAANTIRVYAGARNISALGVGGPGGYSASGFQPWFNTLASRGESGALDNPATDFGPWGGSITFDTSPANAWNFNLNNSVGGQNDFYSVAVHELAHLFGIGTADSWGALINGSNQFTGSASTSANGGNFPTTTADGGHWVSGTNSTVNGANQQAAMTPSIVVGTRKYFTVLDFAGMDDLGWDLAAEGDANADGSVDVTDLGILATNFGQSSGRRWALGDFNYSGTVDVGDLGLLATNFGTSAAGASSGGVSFAEALAQYPELAAAVVPEPAGVTLLALAGTISLARRRRRV